MIKLIIGGIGSGKTLTAAREMLTRDINSFSNFDINHDKTTRLKVSHIIEEKQEGETKTGKPITKKVVNWDFWNKQQKIGKPFDIYIDEAQNVLHARKSMSKWNILFTQWLSQIRKLFGSMEKTHLYLSTQRLGGIDVVGRDLCHEIIYCRKLITTKDIMTTVKEKNKLIEKSLPETYIIKHVFRGEYCVEKFQNFMYRISRGYDFRTVFLANPFYKYYNSYELVKMGETDNV